MPPRLGGAGTSRRGSCRFHPGLVRVCAVPGPAPGPVSAGELTAGQWPLPARTNTPKHRQGTLGKRRPGLGSSLAVTGSSRRRELTVSPVHGGESLSCLQPVRAALTLPLSLPPHSQLCSRQRWLGRERVIHSPVDPYSVVLILNCNQAGGRGGPPPRIGVWV